MPRKLFQPEEWFLSTLFTTSLLLQAERPNVIFILADDLRYGDLGCNGQTKILTPNIDSIASNGMRFTSHYSGQTVCTPSRASPCSDDDATEAVVLVHGLARSPKSMKPLAEYLKKHDFESHLLSYPSTKADVAVLSK
ncbi:esterase/lipase family protein [Rubritalea profundi]|uniref:esterase/lipase family protein n=1 Tax=Rubritalea profundi TaxID=1658618 RepID=UPI000CF57811|nr:sulfatase-like hydrolase/transferase [Rubritalea profundi]